MSETEFNTGTLTKINLKGNIEDKCKEYLLKNNITYNEECYNSYKECVENKLYRVVYITNNQLYEVEYTSKKEHEDIFEASLNKNGVIEFTIKYYNGGCSFNEALDYATKKLNNT